MLAERWIFTFFCSRSSNAYSAPWWRGCVLIFFYGKGSWETCSGQQGLRRSKLREQCKRRRTTRYMLKTPQTGVQRPVFQRSSWAELIQRQRRLSALPLFLCTLFLSTIARCWAVLTLMPKCAAVSLHERHRRHGTSG